MKRKICISLILALIGIWVVLFLLDLANHNWIITPQDMVRPFVILIGLILSLVKLISGGGSAKRSLSFYEKSYQKEIGRAFSEPGQKNAKKTLLKAIALYNENRFNTSISKLNSLVKKCNNRDDFRTVLLFLALNYSDIGLYNQAIDTYLELLRHDRGCSTAWSNLGILYKKEGKQEEAFNCYQNAVLNDDNNPFAWNNLAQAYLTEGYWEKVIEPAERALSIKSDLHSSETALSVAYYALGDEEKSQLYYNRAILHGANGSNLKQILDSLSSGQNPFQE